MTRTLTPGDRREGKIPAARKNLIDRSAQGFARHAIKGNGLKPLHPKYEIEARRKIFPHAIKESLVNSPAQSKTNEIPLIACAGEFLA